MASLNPFQSKPEPQPSEAAPASDAASLTPEPPRGPSAWQPFTPSGVAAFAAASSGYLFFIQVLVALLSSATIVWFVWTGWFPVIDEAIRHLPTEGALIDHALKVPIDPAEPLAASRLLGITGDPEDQGSTGVTTDLLVQFRKTKVRFCSLLGCKDFPYSNFTAYTYVLFNRPELEPKWEAWEPILLAMVAVGSLFALMGSWLVLATVYFLPVWLFGWLKKKSLGPGGSWKLCGAALMPGAVLLASAIIGYRLGVLDLISLFTLFVVHFVMGWVYVVMAALALPKKETLQNPFNEDVSAKAAPAETGSDAATSQGLPSTDSAIPAQPPPPSPGSVEKSSDESAS